VSGALDGQSAVVTYSGPEQLQHGQRIIERTAEGADTSSIVVAMLPRRPQSGRRASVEDRR
jgi:hypothetical protein